MTQRKEAKERTRQRLLEAMIDLLDEEGAGSLTTVRITQRAGVAQPTFYVHFVDVDTGLDVAAEQIAGELLRGLRTLDPRATPEAPPPTSAREALRRVLNGMLEDRRIARVFLRHRRDPNSPFGVRFGRILAGVRDRVVDVARQLGAARPEIVASHVVALVIGTLEGILDGRIAGPDDALDDLTHAVVGMFRPPANRAR